MCSRAELWFVVDFDFDLIGPLFITPPLPFVANGICLIDLTV